MSLVVVLLLTVMVVFWRQDRHPPRATVTLSMLQAKLNDGVQCEFTADIELAGRFGRFVFGLRENTVRAMLIDIVRAKSRYMVSTSTARESLRHEMLKAVNGVMGEGSATAVRLSRFELL